MKKTVIFFVFTCVMGLMFTSASAQEVSIPAWVKNNAGWWANDQIPDSTFVDGIEFLIEKEIIVISDMPKASSEKAESIPSWVKNNAGWWATDQIDDKTFVNGIQHLIKVGIIIVEQTEKPLHTLNEIRFSTSPSNIKLFDTTTITEAAFSKQVKIQYIESLEKGQDDQEFVQIWIKIHTTTNDIVEFVYLKSSETIVLVFCARQSAARACGFPAGTFPGPGWFRLFHRPSRGKSHSCSCNVCAPVLPPPCPR